MGTYKKINNPEDLADLMRKLGEKKREIQQANREESLGKKLFEEKVSSELFKPIVKATKEQIETQKKVGDEQTKVLKAIEEGIEQQRLPLIDVQWKMIEEGTALSPSVRYTTVSPEVINAMLGTYRKDSSFGLSKSQGRRTITDPMKWYFANTSNLVTIRADGKIVHEEAGGNKLGQYHLTNGLAALLFLQNPLQPNYQITIRDKENYKDMLTNAGKLASIQDNRATPGRKPQFIREHILDQDFPQPDFEGEGLKLPKLLPEHVKGKPYRLNGDKFGSLKIDLPLLYRNHLKVKKGGRIIFNEPFNGDDLKDLLMKRLNRKRSYDPKAVGTFNKLVNLSDLPKHAPSSKATIKPMYYNSPEDLAQKVLTDIAAFKAGNGMVKDKIKYGLAELLEIGEITKDVYKDYLNKVFK